jgi:hypothetical protein
MEKKARVGSTVEFDPGDFRGRRNAVQSLTGKVIEKRAEGALLVRVDLGRNEPPHNRQDYTVQPGQIRHIR